MTDMTPKTEKPKVIVSMTSHPPVIQYAVMTIQYLLNGSVLPDKLILYLTFSQFKDIEIPESLLKLARENPIFEIRNYDKNLRSYCKLIPALKDFPDDIIVTVDDDVAYHRDMLRDLLNMHAKHPHAVIAHRAKRIKPGQPYRSWIQYHWYDFLFKRIHESYLNLQTGVGGVLYPPHSLRKEMMDESLFTKLAPTTDDIWFWAAAAVNGYPVIPVPFGVNKPKGVGKPKELALKTFNFKGDKDRNVAAFNAIMEQFPEVKELVKKQLGK